MKFLFLLLFIFSCHSVKNLQGYTMGTSYSIKYLGDIDRESLQKEVDDTLFAFNRIMSTFDSKSELSLINQNKSGEWIKLSVDLAWVLKEALRLSKESNGAYDVTLGPLVNLWGFGPNGERKIPGPSVIKQTQKMCGYDKIILQGQRLKKLHPKVYIDLSSIAKGYGVDVVSRLLEQKGIVNYMVEIGGEINVLGDKDGDGWRIAIETPQEGERNFLKILTINRRLSFATSGDYRNYFTQDDKKFSHTIDGQTGRPVTNDLASVSILSSENCMQADALATMFMAMGKERALAFADANGIAALLVYRNAGGQLMVSKSREFKRYD